MLRVPKVHILQVYPCLISVLVFSINAQQSIVSTLTNVLFHMHDINVVLKLLIFPVWKLVQNTYLDQFGSPMSCLFLLLGCFPKIIFGILSSRSYILSIGNSKDLFLFSNKPLCKRLCLQRCSIGI